MAVGPLLDAYAAHRQGVSTLHVLNHNNRLVAAALPVRVRVLFWLTNLPYWVLAVHLALAPTPLARGNAGAECAHSVAAAVVALASTCFHGVVMFGSALGGQYEQTTKYLLAGDIVAANAYGLTLAYCAGFARAAGRLVGPLVFLMFAATAKRTGAPKSYALLHGVWHLLSALALWRLLYPAHVASY